MTQEVLHISAVIEAPVEKVYAFAADPQNLPRWAAGLAKAELRQEGELWISDSPMGRVRVKFTPKNDLGVLDHDVTLPNGETVYNAFRVIRNGQGTDAIFTLHRRPGVSDTELKADAAMIAEDLQRLKKHLE